MSDDYRRQGKPTGNLDVNKFEAEWNSRAMNGTLQGAEIEAFFRAVLLF